MHLVSIHYLYRTLTLAYAPVTEAFLNRLGSLSAQANVYLLVPHVLPHVRDHVLSWWLGNHQRDTPTSRDSEISLCIKRQ